MTALLLAAPAAAKVFHSRAEALQLAFPDAARVESRTFVLDDAQAAATEARARSRLESRLVTLHSGWQGERLLGYALIDVHPVRTLPEALLIVLSPEGELRSVRMLAFHEPEEYLPAPRWLARFERKRLDAGLRVGGDIQAIAGSTLTSRAVTGAVRRSLALYQVLVRGADEPAAE